MEITINGQVYNDWSEVPPELQQQLGSALPDTDHNGVPDVFEGRLPEPGPHTFVQTSLTVDGKTYDSAGELPPEISAAMKRVFVRGDEAGTAPGTAAAPHPAAGPAPAAAHSAAEPGQVVLNGETVDITADGVAKPRKSLWQRLFG